MSIFEALVDGELVYAERAAKMKAMGEAKQYNCIDCGALLTTKHFPLHPNRHYFALLPGQEHTNSECQALDKKRSAPAFLLSPAALIAKLMQPSRPGGGGGGGTEVTDEDDDYQREEKMLKIRPITNLRQINKMQISKKRYKNKVHEGAELCYGDFILYFAWAKYILSRGLIKIYARIIVARWGGYSNDAKTVNRVIERCRKYDELWYEMWWTDNRGDKRYVRFCAECEHDRLKDVRNKLFTKGTRKNGTCDVWAPKKGIKDALLATNWLVLDREQCKEICPFGNCEHCHGAYWGKINNVKQVELFDQNEDAINEQN